MSSLDREYAALHPQIDSAIKEVLVSGRFIGGDIVKSFESDLGHYLKAPFVTSCGSGTDALLIAMLSLNIEPGDEVIMPAFGYISAYEMCRITGIVPILVDISSKDFMIDADQIEARLTDRTKAIIIQHLFGQGADMQHIMTIAERYGLLVIEDAAQALGTDIKVNNTWQKAGTIGHVGCFSFFPNKNLGCYGDGGAICTKDEHLAEQIRMTANHGQITKYQHNRLGINSRLDAIQAAILKVKLPYLDGWLSQRQQNALIYDKGLKNENTRFSIPYRVPNSTHTYHQYTLSVEPNHRAKLTAILKDSGIETAVYYPRALHQQYIYECSPQDYYPSSEYISQSVLSIPIHPYLSAEELNKVVETINSTT